MLFVYHKLKILYYMPLVAEGFSLRSSTFAHKFRDLKVAATKSLNLIYDYTTILCLEYVKLHSKVLKSCGLRGNE